MHVPVLLNETIAALSPRRGGAYIDGTLGGGGHAEEILRRSEPDGMLLGFDRDGEAVERCRARLAPFGRRFQAVHAPFSEMAAEARRVGFPAPDGILLDLGVSSFQLDTPERGFSFRADGPLDMRMDTSCGLTAAQFIDSFTGDPEGLARIFREYGEEPHARRVARAILAEREKGPFSGTAHLAAVVERALGGRRGSARHPATRVFQALRIAVNDEFGQLKSALEIAISLLAPGGALAVISFHSLEDGIVKRALRSHEARQISLEQGGVRVEGAQPFVERILRRAVSPADAEIAANPRARSAKLRAVRRLPDAA